MPHPLKFKYRNYGQFDTTLYLSFFTDKKKQDARLYTTGALFLPAGKKGDFVMFCEHPDRMVALLFEKNGD